MVEQGTHKPLAVGSNPSPATFCFIGGVAIETAGGIYLFEDEASLNALLEGPLAAHLTGKPSLSELRLIKFDVMENVNAITRCPV